MSEASATSTTMRVPGPIESTLRAVRDSGRKCLVPYITGGLGDDWLASLAAVIDGGADACEIGIPFSDPVMDGPIIQQANDIALAAGVTPHSICADLRNFESPIPLATMTYYNIAYRMGHERFANMLNEAGISGSILPDIQMDESADWIKTANANGIENILFAAPTSPDERLERTGEMARGFVYAVGLLGITGERSKLAASALEIARRAKEYTALPVLVGVGIGSPEQAVEACSVADGVIIGSTVVRRLVEGSGSVAERADSVRELIGEYRSALDTAFPGEP
jgi:tryptophan synthase alpha chain